MPVHLAATQGFTAGVESYEAGRPDYPAAVDAWLRQVAGLRQGKRVLELGAGTGKFTGGLLATGAEVVAVDAVPAMLAHLCERYPQVEAHVGEAEQLPLENDAVDAAFCAQAFHWFATPRTVAELRRVLRPGGLLALVWNVRDERAGWVGELGALVEPYAGDAPRYASGAWKAVFPAGGFSPLTLASFSHEHGGPAEAVVVERTRSISFVARLDPAEQQALLSRVRALVARTPELAGEGPVRFPYVTEIWSARRER